MGSEIWARGYGVKSKAESSGPPDHDTIFRIGSISKVFSALVMYQLYDRGLVKSLDDPLSDYCPRFSMLNPFNSRNITLRQIASQMSGLPREAPCTAVVTEDGTINACPQTTDEILDRLQDVSLMFPTWTIPSYSNLGFSLLGHCLVGHFFPSMTYEEYVFQHILEPLELTNTGFNMTKSVVEKMAVGYWIPAVGGQGSEEAPLVDLGWIGPTGQMYSTTADLNKMVAFFTSANGEEGSDPVHPEVMSGDTRREMQLQVYVNRDQRTGFGTPWEIRFQANYTVLRKGGNVPGHSSIMSFVPELQLGLNMLWSGAYDEFGASNEAYDYLIPAFVEYLMTVQPPYPYPPDPEVYEGVYDFGPFEAQVRTSRNRLLLRSPIVTFGGSLILAYKEPLRFQMVYPDHLQMCLIAQLVSRRKAFVVFEPPVNSTSPSPGFSIPGAFPGWFFQRRP
jgi:CubicO group peptidase (beta-lactamase class C family)